MSDYRYNLDISAANKGALDDALLYLEKQGVVPDMLKVEFNAYLGLDGLYHMDLSTENVNLIGTVPYWDDKDHEALFGTMSKQMPAVLLKLTGENIDDPSNSIFMKAFHNGLYKEAHQEKQDIEALLDQTPWHSPDNPLAPKEAEAYMHFERLRQQRGTPALELALDMFYIEDNCDFDVVLTPGELYALAQKLKAADYDNMMERMLHEEHLDALCYMLNNGLVHAHTPEFPTLGPDATRQLLLNCDLKVFGALVETVAIHNMELEYYRNQDTDRVVAVIDAMLGKTQSTPEQPEEQFATLEEALFAAAENLDWSCTEEIYSNGRYIYFAQASPAGEDFGFSVPEYNIVGEVRAYADDFDIDEHVGMWLGAKGNVSGVPDAVTLVDDAREIQTMLNDLAEALEEASDRFLAQQSKPKGLDGMIASAQARAETNQQPGQGREDVLNR